MYIPAGAHPAMPLTHPMRFIENDGGRKAAGHEKDRVGDCVARSMAIVTGWAYDEVCVRLADAARGERARPRSDPHKGIHTGRSWFKAYMKGLGFIWTPTMGIGTGCKVHMKDGELPTEGRFLVRLSQHYTALVDGVIMDTYDPSRDGKRCVYGFWRWQGETRKDEGQAR